MSLLRADSPVSDPKSDLFGHAPFAKNLAESIAGYTGTEGLVLSLYGPWGAGKSTVLSFVVHHLENEHSVDKPVVVQFNPWWFSGQENLARAFLGQLQAVLPQKDEKFRKLGSMLGDFSEGIGGLVDLSGVTGGGGRILGKFFASITKRKPKDVPGIKDDICKLLLKAGQKILIIIDDIDRLDPEETRQLFTVIKALGDFPNVVYLLAFDREVASQAIEHRSGLPGERYLEKIVQVPFELPPVDRLALRKALFQRLDEILGQTDQAHFDQKYWTNVFFEGVDPIIKVPRDVVRLTNTLSITFPVVKGEVNVVDFIALEAIRVFLPDVYEIVRSNPQQFAGYNSNSQTDIDRRSIAEFAEVWQGLIPDSLKESTVDLLERVFPKIAGTGFGSDWMSQWRKELRVCHPDVFPVYFRLAPVTGAVSGIEIRRLVEVAGDTELLTKMLLDSTQVLRADGISKTKELLEIIVSSIETDIASKNLPTLIAVALDVGDKLIEPEETRGMFDFGNISRIGGIVYHGLKRIPAEDRAKLLDSSISKGDAIACQSRVLAAIEEEVPKGEDRTLLTAAEIAKLKATWVNRVKILSQGSLFIDHPSITRVIRIWGMWSSPSHPREWCEAATCSDEGLLKLITSFLSFSTSQTMGDLAVQRQARLNPTLLEDYIDTSAAAHRLYKLREDGKVPVEASAAVDQYLIEFEMITNGIDPEGIDAFDE